jgi:hypothetical protein
MTQPLKQETVTNKDSKMNVEKVQKKNDIKEIRSIKQLNQVNLDLDSPRIKQAMENLGITENELFKKELQDFEQPGVEAEVITLRHKHYQSRLVETINMVLEERKRIKLEFQRNAARSLSQNQPMFSL